MIKKIILIVASSILAISICLASALLILNKKGKTEYEELSFEEMCEGASAIVKVRPQGSLKIDNKTRSYRFFVTECYNTIDDEIYYKNVVWHQYSADAPPFLWHIDFSAKEEYLMWVRLSPKPRPEGAWCLEVSSDRRENLYFDIIGINFVIPVDDIENAKAYGEPLSEHIDMELTGDTTADDIIDYALDLMKDNKLVRSSEDREKYLLRKPKETEEAE